MAEFKLQIKNMELEIAQGWNKAKFEILSNAEQKYNKIRLQERWRQRIKIANFTEILKLTN